MNCSNTDFSIKYRILRLFGNRPFGREKERVGDIKKAYTRYSVPFAVGQGMQCVFIILGCACFVTSQLQINFEQNPAVFYTTIELICSEGYHAQDHTVVTNDGYMLSVHRIPGGKRRPKVPKTRNHYYYYLHQGYHPAFASCINDSLKERPTGHPVLLVHGLTAASDCWVMQGEKYDLAFLLADRGYDVWIANIRGNFYSRKHKTIDPSDPKFWDFSFHENGVSDLTSTIDYILNLRGLPKLIYVGHSMGTTAFFVLASARPEYQKKMQLFIGLTPVSQLKRENLSINRMGILNTTIRLAKGFLSNGISEIMPRSELWAFLSQLLCSKGSSLQDFCYDFFFFFTGYHSKLYLRKTLPIYMGHGFSGSSAKTFLHYEQLLDTDDFQFYDHGPEENLRRFGQPDPPKYNLSMIKMPVALFYSKGDTIAYWKDVERLITLLPNVIETHVYGTLNHIDFILAYNAKDIIFGKVMALIEKYKTQ